MSKIVVLSRHVRQGAVCICAGPSSAGTVMSSAIHVSILFGVGVAGVTSPRRGLNKNPNKSPRFSDNTPPTWAWYRSIWCIVALCVATMVGSRRSPRIPTILKWSCLRPVVRGSMPQGEKFYDMTKKILVSWCCDLCRKDSVWINVWRVTSPSVGLRGS